MGTRLSWDQFSTSSDEAPNTMWEIDATLGQYSNLPSYQCVVSPKGGTPPTGAVTACGVGLFTSLPNVSRVLIPRLDISGYAKFPNFPFVLGVDANLAQYGVFNGGRPIDFLNKPGNDVRIYVGYRINLGSAFKLVGTSVPTH